VEYNEEGKNLLNPGIYFSDVLTKPNFVPDTSVNKVIMKRLSELEPGTIARIHSFEKNDLFLKLMEMGCVPGELIKVEQIAPLGDPISITVAGYNLSLRLDEADNIFMEEEVL
jgi:Fe2+ transport system protein FeoA